MSMGMRRNSKGKAKIPTIGKEREANREVFPPPSKEKLMKML